MKESEKMRAYGSSIFLKHLAKAFSCPVECVQADRDKNSQSVSVL